VTYTFTTQAQVRAAFWQGNAHLRSAYRRGKRQNDYSATIRSEWVEFVDMLTRDGHIAETLAQRITL
jgi:hypothetical protein